MTRERLSSLRARLREEAAARGVNSRDIDVLIADAVAKPLSYVVAHGEMEIDSAPVVEMARRRFAGEPLQYIRRRADFYGREFYVDDRVLIPRPETEQLVETALKLAATGSRIVDVGAGSGAIAVTVALERPDLHVTTVDVSVGALAVTRFNAQRHGAPVTLAASNVLSSIDGRFDLILSNPPYIPAADIEDLQVEVREHEPAIALTPGRQGTEIIERLLDEAASRLATGGRVIIEIGFGQENAVRELAARRGYRVDTIVPDLAGIPRTVVLSRHGD